MARSAVLCERYQRGESAFDNGLDAGRYLAAVACDQLPGEVVRDDRSVARGYAVGFGQWFFFPAIEPALAFGRAARMSLDCLAYGVYEAAREVRFCHRHEADERALLIGLNNVDRCPEEVEHLKRFVQGVKERPWSAHWHSPTGYLTDYNKGRPVSTRQRSLPL